MRNTNIPKNSVQKSGKLLQMKFVIGVFFIALALMFILGFVSYLRNWQEDQSQVGYMFDKSVKSSNFFGKLGDWLGNVFIFESLGITAFIIPFLLLVFASFLFGFKFFKLWKTISHSLFFTCWLPIFIGAITRGEGVASGVYGFQIYDYASSIIGGFGLWLCIILSIFIYFMLEFNSSFQSISEKIKNIKSQSITIGEDGEPIEKIVFVNEEIEVEKERIEVKPIQILSSASHQSETVSSEEKNMELPRANINAFALTHTTSFSLKGESQSVEKNIFGSKIDFEPKQEISHKENLIALNNHIGDLEVEVEIPIKDEETLQTIAGTLVEKHGLYDHKMGLPNFKLPGLELLKDYGNEEITINKEELEANKNKIIGLLRNFNIGIVQIKATIGPTVTLYEIVPEAGIRVSSIKKLQDDIALNLAALGIRIIAPMPGKGTIGIEVPNQMPTMVSMRSVLSSHKFQNTDMDLPVVFGRTISNDIFMADLAKMPHLLMAGATGQGKSVGINVILASLLYKKHPSELKFVMVDPKKVELSLYSKIERHYLAKLPDTEEAILTDNSKVINTLNSLCIEMDTRYELLKNAFCRNLKEYNQKFTERKLNPESGHCYLPYIVLVVDEFADLIMTAGKEVEYPIARLAQLARAVGIHLIIATQRPSVNVITGMIKANFPARASFRVNASVDSRTILDTTGADQLIGKGDMLYSNGNDLIRVQCAFIDTPEVEKIADFIGEQKGYFDAYFLPECVGEESSAAGEFSLNDRDSLFEEAARIVVGAQQGSTSMLQRQLKLGYNRAGRIMDQLEVAGIVGNFNGAKAREVLIGDLHSLEQFLEDLK